MIKKTITFNDLDDNPVVEDFYFALNAAEVTRIVVADDELMSFFEKVSMMQEGKTADITGREIIAVFQKLIQISVGKRGEDGRRFIKNDQIRDDLVQSDAYSQLFIEICTDTPKAIEFFNGVMPSNLPEILAKLETARAQNEAEGAKNASGSVEPAWVTEGRIPTNEELKSATPEQIQLAFQRKTQGSEVIPSQ